MNEELFESLNLDESAKTLFKKSFDDAVLVQSVKLAEKKSSEYKDYLNEEIAKRDEKLIDSIDTYLDTVVEKWVADNTPHLNESADKMKYEAILEGFDKLLTTTGVGIAQIAESKEVADVREETKKIKSLEKSLAESKTLSNTLMREKRDAKAKFSELARIGLISEAKVGMTLPQQKEFEKMADMIEFNESAIEDYVDKLDVFKATITKETPKTSRRSTHSTPRRVTESTSKEKVSETKAVDVSKYI